MLRKKCPRCKSENVYRNSINLVCKDCGFQLRTNENKNQKLFGELK